jgi:hypothetical protein
MRRQLYQNLQPDFAWSPSVSGRRTGATGFVVENVGRQRGNDGTLTNMDPAMDWVTSDGRMALDLEVDNNDCLLLGAGIAPGTSDFTWSIWSKPETFSASYHMLISASGFYAYLSWVGSPAFLAFDTLGNVIHRTDTAVGVLGEWQLCTAVRRHGMDMIYHNGRLVSTPEADTFGITGSMEIGRYATDRTLYYDGLIDDCLFFKRGLLDAEMLQLYEIGRGGWATMRRRSVAKRAAAAAATQNAAFWLTMMGQLLGLLLLR